MTVAAPSTFQLNTPKTQLITHVVVTTGISEREGRCIHAESHWPQRKRKDEIDRFKVLPPSLRSLSRQLMHTLSACSWAAHVHRRPPHFSRCPPRITHTNTLHKSTHTASVWLNNRLSAQTTQPQTRRGSGHANARLVRVIGGPRFVFPWMPHVPHVLVVDVVILELEMRAVAAMLVVVHVA